MDEFIDYVLKQNLLTEISQICKEIPKDILSKLIDDKIVYKEQIVTTFGEFYGNVNKLMQKIYLFLKDLLQCSIIRQWMKWKDTYNLKVYDIETEKFINYNDSRFSRCNESRKYKFFWE